MPNILKEFGDIKSVRMAGIKFAQETSLFLQGSILTLRETEYLSLVGFGYKNKEIAIILTVSLSTVKKTLEKIFLKINAKDRANAVTIAFLHHIIDDRVLEYVSKKYKLPHFQPLPKQK